MTVGDLGTQGNWLVYPSPLTEAQVVNIGTGDNALQLSGSSTDTGTKFVYKAIDWSSRTAGNDFLYTEFIMQTGPSTTSLNSFNACYFDDQLNLAFGLKYFPNTNIVKGLIYDNDGTYYVSLSIDGVDDLTLTDDTDYTVFMWYNNTKGEAYWYIIDEQFNTVCMQAISFLNPNSVTDFNLVAVTTTGNDASTYLTFDDITVKARPCMFDDTMDDVTFSYSESTLCNTAAAVTPTLTDASVTGVFTSTPAGLTIDASSGLVTASSSIVGAYTIQFASNVENTCDDSTTVALTIQDCASLPEHLTSAFSVAPNPAQNFITVTLSDNFVSNGVITLMTSEGKEVETRIVSNNKEEVFNVSNLEAGIYFVQFADKIEKVVVQ